MSCRTIECRLHDWVEGALSDRRRRLIERHMEQCPHCRELARGLQQVRQETERLPRERHPRRDLWPQIERRIERVGARQPRKDRWSPRLLPLVAATVLLLAIGGLLLRMSMGPAGFSRRPAPTAALLAGLEGDYHLLFTEWTAMLRGVGDRFAPEVRQTIQDNLEAAEAAIATTREAAERNPHDRELHAMLSAAYRQKAELLEWSARTAALLE